MDWLILHSGQGGMLRRYALFSVLIVAGTALAASGIVSLVKQAMPDQSARLTAHQAIQEGARTYSVTRSILDDQIMTGSVTKVEPCGK